jgi:hypothetical protein
VLKAAFGVRQSFDFSATEFAPSIPGAMLLTRGHCETLRKWAGCGLKKIDRTPVAEESWDITASFA